jgi:D-lactate dehydrogenase (cytochrome)
LSGVRVCAFGHVGDGNIHYNLSQPENISTAEFLSQWERCNLIVHDIAVSLGGSFSAEHGVGRLKLNDMTRYKSATELGLMRMIKQTLDPRGILNANKVIPAPQARRSNSAAGS